MTVQRNSALGFVFITLLIDVIGLGIIIPVIPALIQQLTGCDIPRAATYGSFLTFSYAIMQFICSPVMGALSDRFGRRPVLLLSLLGLGIDYFVQALSPTLALLFIGRIIAGMAGASFTTATAYIADISTPEKRGQNFGIIGAAFGLGFIIGPTIGSLCSIWGKHYGVSGQFDWSVRLPFIVAGCFSLLNVIYGYFVLPESLDKDHRRAFQWKRAHPISPLKNLRKYPIVSGLALSLFLIYLAGNAVQSNWNYYTIYKFSWSKTMVGISLTVVGLLVSLVQGLLIRKTTPFLGEKNSVYVGLSFYFIGMVLFAFATQGWMMFAFLVPYCLGGIGGPVLQGIISNQVPDNAQGELQGALTSLISITSFLGPLIMNNLFSWFTGSNAPFIFPGMPFLLGAAMILTAIFLAVPSLKNYHKTK